MGEDEERPSTSKSPAPPLIQTGSSRPTIALPPRTSMESFFNGGTPGSGFGFSPGPMTLVSSFFSDNDDCKSFSQLLAGAMSSPAAGPVNRDGFPPLGERGSGEGAAFKQNRPLGLAISQSPTLTIPPGLSPTGLLDSSGLLSPGQGPFGMTHQQALAQVTAQATQPHPHFHIQTDYSSSVSAEPATSLTQVSNRTTYQMMPPSIPDLSAEMKESPGYSHSEQRLQSSSLTVDKPANDDYNWRKYGQKQVKGSEFPRSYYKCTHPNCPVKKKVERSLDGQITAIIYKGHHNHQPPQPTKHPKDTGNPNENSNYQGNPGLASQPPTGNLKRLKEGIAPYSVSKKDQEYSQATAEQLSGTSDSEEVGDADTGVDEKDEDEPHPKRRNPEGKVPEPASSHRTVTEPRIVVQTTSEVDLLDDGFRWRKYGQKVVKGNPYPRSYYKCTTPGCNVRKHVERASTDPKAVITTYEGKHNHDVPAAKNSSHKIAINSASQLKSQATGTEKQTFNNRDLGGNEQRPIARLKLKEEQMTYAL
ncbi:WRKY transcription factor [Quillaja saponaria]|uniref:WRKY transcription factor n=1 Tax=Quillaja saponaria TaxID=32244 RepID=A0AAD7KP31_QUISA|nr:WRKY transcription factor [Quillaja saponaria]